ncbi:hypothetical protein SALCHL_004254 [Streptomyces albus subsp. chlorinus]|uniref:hypothetical protein n=1 Tax=Streptomyces albus TaxID=1888 RepID=UPI0015708AC2|nr:hypothetical protein [Streptomyces albus]
MSSSAWHVRPRERWWLAAVCAVFGALSLTVVQPGLPLGWDEIVYASRFAPHGPGTPFSAPRTRGVPALIAPVAAVSGSVVLLRCYLTLTASLALYLGYLPWLRAGAPRGVVPAAAALYGSVWFALFYAGAAMPNHYVAMGLTCATGCLVRARRGWAALAGAAGALAVAALIRPNDAVWPAAVLLAAAPAVRGRPCRPHPTGAAAVVGGVAAGLAPWAVEARLRFGGVLERVRAAEEVQGGMSPRLPLGTLKEHAAALDGPLLCRPCDGAGIEWSGAGWWLLVPPLVGLGLRAARREGRTAWGTLPLAAAVAVAVPYLFFMGYAAPRFLLPAYALLAPVAALGVREAARWARRVRARHVLLPLGGAIAALHLALQLHQLTLHSRIQAEARHDWQRMERVLRAHGVRPPCVLAGTSATIPIAHTAGCRSTPAHRPSALVLRRAALPGWASAAGWRLHRVPGTYNPDWHIAVPPPTAGTARTRGASGAARTPPGAAVGGGAR